MLKLMNESPWLTAFLAVLILGTVSEIITVAIRATVGH